MKSKSNLFLCFLIASLLNTFCLQAQRTTTDFVQLSQNFLTDVKDQKNTAEHVQLLANADFGNLKDDLNTDQKKYAFWINIYNAFILEKLTKNPALYEDRRSFFKNPQLNIAGNMMSFADIEHGILRRSQLELFLGYMTNPFASKIEKSLRVEKRDYRIHFALNCGAKSCPPILIYDDEELDTQLDRISQTFLNRFSSYDSEANLVTTTSLFSWFRGDFGGSQGIREILHKFSISPSTEVDIITSPYDWSLYLNNFAGDLVK